MKKLMPFNVVCLVFILSANAQNFTGTYVIQSKEMIDGKQYVNAIAQEITVTQTKDSLKIIRVIPSSDVTFGVIGHAQTSVKAVSKPALTINDLGKWPSVSNPKLSNDGRYAIYTYNASDKQSLVIKSTNVTWEKQIGGASTYNAVITENSQFVLAKVRDSLFIVRLKDGQTEVVPGVVSYKAPQEGDGQWLAYQLSSADKSLVLRNLASGKENRFSSTVDYLFNSNGTVLLLKQERVKDSSSLRWYNLRSGKSATIWQGQRAGNFCVEATGQSLAFIGEDPNNGSVSALWYYKQGMDRAVVLADNSTEGIEKGLGISSDQVRFNRDGSKVFFYLASSPLPKPKPGYVSVDVWSWQDVKLQSQQLKEVGSENRFIAIININLSLVAQSSNESKVIRLEYEGDKVSSPVEGKKCDYLLVENRLGDRNESFWNNRSYLNVFLTSTKDGNKKLLKGDIPYWPGYFSISPDERFVIYYDGQSQSLVSYEIASGATRNLTKEIPVDFDKDFYGDLPFDSNASPFSIATWTKKDKSIIIYDRYDLWQIDPLNNIPPICLTNRYGRKNKIKFSLLFGTTALTNVESNNTLPVKLTGFNENNKENGFYDILLGKSKDPSLLFKASGIMYTSSVQTEQIEPMKAKKAKIYLVSQKNESTPLNCFTTKDFRNYHPLTNVTSPSENYNWLTTELVRWKTFDGTESQGILYKPADFDSTKKYPVIFNYYETKSEKLHDFLPPQLSGGDLNIPYFVSNGYLVFLPDIHFKTGATGESILNCLGSAARYLSKKSWIDSTKMGIQGFSFGGYETYYLVTHSNLFAAACAADGLTDLISFYGSMCRFGYAVNWAERGQGRLGCTPWDNQKIYIDNSPIFKANDVNTPLLMLHNKNDYQGLYQQGIEFFTAMRRLGKRAWMLQYEHGQHGVSSPNDAEDFTIRMKQFFDHYLKGAPAPLWMTKGIAAAMKGIETGYELDPSGNCGLPGKPCHICDAWNKQFKRNPAMFQKPISEWELDKDIEAEMNNKETERYRGNMKGEEKRIKENNEKLNGTWKGGDNQ